MGCNSEEVQIFANLLNSIYIKIIETLYMATNQVVIFISKWPLKNESWNLIGCYGRLLNCCLVYMWIHKMSYMSPIVSITIELWTHARMGPQSCNV